MNKLNESLAQQNQHIAWNEKNIIVIYALNFPAILLLDESRH